MSIKISSLLTILCFTISCANVDRANKQRGEVVKDTATHELDCPRKKLTVIPLDATGRHPAGNFDVEGCERKATYYYDINTDTAKKKNPQ